MKRPSREFSLSFSFLEELEDDTNNENEQPNEIH